MFVFRWIDSGKRASQSDAVIQRENDGVRWELQPDFAPLLESLLKSRGEIVKESPVKSVTRHEVGGKVFYIKRYLHHAVALRPLKYLFKATQARQEWDLAQQLEARNIPIVRHVALGERRSWRGVQESILVTEGFDGVEAAQVPDLDPSVVLEFVNRMHARGVVQDDLHLANLLVKRSPFELRLVDLHGTRVCESISPDERERNLAVLRVHLPVAVSEAVEVRSRELRKRLLYERSWRCLRNNRDFSKQMHGSLKWHVRLSFVDDAMLRILVEPDEFLRTRAVILKPGRTATVGKADGFVLKRFNFRKAQNLIKDLARRSRAERAFQKAYHLEIVGIPTARAVAAARRRSYGILLRSYFLMEELPRVTDLGAWLKAGNNPESGMVQELGRLIARLHEEGFSHRDLKFSNIVVGPDRQLSLLDLDGVAYVHELASGRAAADLRRLARVANAVPAIGMRWRRMFVRAYCQARKLRSIPRLNEGRRSIAGR